MATVRASLVLSVGQNLITTVIGIAAVMVLARLLTPEEVGVWSVAAAVVAFAHMLRDFGVGNYLIQEKELKDEDIQAAFLVTSAAAILAAAILAVSSGYIADFYDDQRIQPVLWVLSVNLLLLPWTAPRLSLLRRDMRFDKVVQIQIFAAVAGPAVSISCAAFGMGPMALALGALGTTVAMVLLAVWFLPKPAAWGLGLGAVRKVMSFGWRSATTALVSQTGVNAAELIIGRVIDLTSLGLYSRAIGLMNMFNHKFMGAISAVAFPHFSALSRERADLGAAYLRACALVSGIAWPFFIFAGLMAHPLVGAMFGDQWYGSVPLIRILVVGGLLYHLIPFPGPTLLSLGRVDLMLRGEIITQATRIVLVLIGAFYGLEAVCVAYVVTIGIKTEVYRRLLLPLLEKKVVDVLRTAAPSLLLAVLASVGPLSAVLIFGLEPREPWLPLLLAGPISGVSWLGGVYLLEHAWKKEVTTVLLRLGGLARRGAFGQ